MSWGSMVSTAVNLPRKPSLARTLAAKPFGGSASNAAHWKKSGTFEFLGFEFRWGRGRWGSPVIKRRTARKKYRASLASFQAWCRLHCRMPKEAFFTALNAKLRGYYNYYGIRGNFKSIGDFYYQVTQMHYR
jgi:RNA-directed DNA polymerase